jgi:tetratricopeptide (TPR) repeat protein
MRNSIISTLLWACCFSTAWCFEPHDEVVVVRRTHFMAGEKELSAAVPGALRAVREHNGEWVRCFGTSGWIHQDFLLSVTTAEAAFQERLKSNPKDVDALCGLAKFQERQKKYEAAIDLLNQAVALEASWLTHYARGNCLSLRKLHKEAIADYEQAIVFDKTQLSVREACADAWADAGDKKKALELCSEMIGEDQQRHTTYSMRGVLWSGMENHERALQDLDIAIFLGDEDSDYYLVRAIVYTDLNRIPEAVKDLQQAITCGSRDSQATAFTIQAAIELAQDKIKPAFEHANAALATHPRSVLALEVRLGCYLALQEYDKALVEGNKVLEIEPERAGGWNNRARIWWEKKEYDKALSDCNRAIELSPHEVIYYDKRGAILMEMGEFEKASSDLHKALELDPNDNKARSHLAWLFVTAPEEKLRNCKEAAKLMAAIPKKEIDDYCLEVMAALFAEHGDFEQAIATQYMALAIMQQNLTKLKVKQSQLNEAKERLKLYEAKKPYRSKAKAS